jgi:hypothetical protein
VWSSKALRPYCACRRFASAELKPFFEESVAWTAAAILEAGSAAACVGCPATAWLLVLISSIANSSVARALCQSHQSSAADCRILICNNIKASCGSG